MSPFESRIRRCPDQLTPNPARRFGVEASCIAALEPPQWQSKLAATCEAKNNEEQLINDTDEALGMVRYVIEERTIPVEE
ncbi:MAG: hypothetical protein ACXWJB_09065 [Limisphaerales bacterium]